MSSMLETVKCLIFYPTYQLTRQPTTCSQMLAEDMRPLGQREDTITQDTAGSMSFMSASVSVLCQAPGGQCGGGPGQIQVHSRCAPVIELRKPQSFQSKPTQILPQRETLYLLASTWICPLLQRRTLSLCALYVHSMKNQSRTKVSASTHKVYGKARDL